jgi:hypothetical protein
VERFNPTEHALPNPIERYRTILLSMHHGHATQHRVDIAERKARNAGASNIDILAAKHNAQKQYDHENHSTLLQFKTKRSERIMGYFLQTERRIRDEGRAIFCGETEY